MPQVSIKDSNARGAEDVDESRFLIGLIAEEEIAIGFLLAGIGECPLRKAYNKNYMIVEKDTSYRKVEKFFNKLYNKNRIGVILISSGVMKHITLPALTRSLPIILEFPNRNTLVEQFEAHELETVNEKKWTKTV